MAEPVGRSLTGAGGLLSLCLPGVLISVGEAALFVGHFGVCLAAHLANILACILLPVFLRRDPTIWHAFMLASLLRVLNLGMPDIPVGILGKVAAIYVPLIIVSSLILLNSDTSRRPRPLSAEVWSTLRMLGRRLRASFHPSPVWALYIIGGAALAWALANVEYAVLSTGHASFDYLPAEPSLMDLAALFLAMTFLVGLGEEMIFRYAMQGTISRFLGPAGGIGLSSLIFAIMHSGQASTDYIVVIFFMSTIIGAIYYKTKNLALVVYIHGTLNFLLYSFLPQEMMLLPWG